ncbi:hypothetical protein GQ53DRAFT_877825 [Thozetella sp. PMI_491]|nr:hypothetical protein GQ53DRAFT_877825 [Thozetella sp. PMI_491]
MDPNSFRDSASAEKQDTYHSAYSVDQQPVDAMSPAPWARTRSAAQEARDRLVRVFKFHSLGVGMTVVLLWINSRQIFWFSTYDVNGKSMVHNTKLSTTVVLNLLQFCAKWHEIFMIASLAALTISIYKRRLLGPGLPLGLLSGGYRVGDLAYLLNGSFWAGLRSSSTSYRPAWIALLLLFMTLLSTVLGPASAIVILPTEGWFPLPGPFKELQMPIIYGAPDGDVWPRQANDSLIQNLDECRGGDAIFTGYCPAGGFSEIYNWAFGYKYAGLSNNITFQQSTTTLGRQLIMNEPEGSDATFLTTISAASVGAMGRLVDYIESGVDVGQVAKEPRYQLSLGNGDGVGSRNYQPVVQTQCVLYDRDDCKAQAVMPYFKSSSINCFGSSGCKDFVSDQHQFIVSREIWNTSATNKAINAQLIPTISDQNNGSVLLSAGLIPYDKNDTQGSWVYGCVVVAHWAQSQLSVDPTVNRLVQSSIDMPANREALGDLRIEADKDISFTPAWIDAISPTFNRTVIEEKNQTEFAGLDATEPLYLILYNFLVRRYNRADPSDSITYINLGQGFYGNESTDSSAIAKVLQRVVGAMTVDGLARSAANSTTYALTYEDQYMSNYTEVGLRMGNGMQKFSIVASKKDPDHGNATVFLDGEEGEIGYTLAGWRAGVATSLMFTIHTSRYGYGSGQSSPTLSFGLAMVSAYLAIIGIYGLFAVLGFFRSLARRRVAGSGDAWEDIEDVLVLALQSTPPEALLYGEEKGLWENKVALRADTDGHARLMVGSTEERTGLIDHGRR